MWVGIDAWKEHHHAAAVDDDGRVLWSRRMANDQAAIAELIDRHRQHADVVLGVVRPDQQRDRAAAGDAGRCRSRCRLCAGPHGQDRMAGRVRRRGQDRSLVTRLSSPNTVRMRRDFLATRPRPPI